MTKKIAISLPDDIADRLSTEKNVSAFIAEALRRRIAHERTMEMLAQAGYTIDQAEMDEAYGRLTAAHRAMTPKLRREAEQALEEARRVPR